MAESCAIKVELKDDKIKKKAIKAVSSFSGMNFIFNLFSLSLVVSLLLKKSRNQEKEKENKNLHCITFFINKCYLSMVNFFFERFEPTIFYFFISPNLHFVLIQYPS